jgi:hypothetical protein
VTLRAKSGRSTAESVDDVTDWLHQLSGCPQVQRTVIATCRQPSHGDEHGTWWLVEADSTEGVGRLRCLACGTTRAILDSEQRWTYPAAWSCRECRQAIAEVVYGLHCQDGVVTWIAMAVRCVNCGDIGGVADFVVPGLPTAEVIASL